LIDDGAVCTRGFDLAVIILFAVAMVVPAVQNLEIVTFALSGSKIGQALAL